MKEKVLKARPGMPFLINFILLYILAVGLIIYGGIHLDKGNNIGALPLVVGVIWALIGYIPFIGLKILKPQEALVLTLFGKYTGTLREAGFYFVNPFSSSVNPAYKTQLSQSGDINTIPTSSVKVEEAMFR